MNNIIAVGKKIQEIIGNKAAFEDFIEYCFLQEDNDDIEKSKAPTSGKPE